MAVIQVEDDGIGIEPDSLEEIFRPFSQVEKNPVYSRQGTGLGLTISRRFAELHGGRLWAVSKGKDEGSMFTLELPIPNA